MKFLSVIAKAASFRSISVQRFKNATRCGIGPASKKQANARCPPKRKRELVEHRKKEPFLKFFPAKFHDHFFPIRPMGVKLCIGVYLPIGPKREKWFRWKTPIPCHLVLNYTTCYAPCHTINRFTVIMYKQSYIESISKGFPDEISCLFLPYKSYESETLHRVLSQLVLIKKHIPFAGNNPLYIFPMPSSAKLLRTSRSYRGRM